MPENKNLQSWDLFGDINPIEYGGTFARRESPETESLEYISIVRSSEDDTTFLFHGAVVWPEDFLDKDIIKEDAEEAGISAQELLHECPARYVDTLLSQFGCGPFEFSPTNIHGHGAYSMLWDEFKATPAEIVQFLKEHDIPEQYYKGVEQELKDKEENLDL